MWNQDIYDDSLIILMAGCYLLNQKNNTRRKIIFWMRSSVKRRSDYSGKDLQRDDIGLDGELRSSCQNVSRMSSDVFEELICLIGSIIGGKNYCFLVKDWH